MAQVTNNHQDIDRNEVIVCGVTWGGFIANTTPQVGTLDDSAWFPPAGVTVHDDDIAEDVALVKVSVPDGEVGEVYRVRNHVGFSDGQSRDATLILRVVEN